MKIADDHDDLTTRQGRRRRRLRSLRFAPTLITLGNLTCGFAAIHFAMRAMYELGAGQPTGEASAIHPRLLELMLPSPLSVGAGLVLLGMVFDMFDGLVARVTRSTTNFGGQLDSLADTVSFGAAPAALMVAFMSRQLEADAIIPSPISNHFWGRFTWVCAAIYVAMTAVRLARFNVEHAEDGFDHRTFRGLPSPGAAAIVVALVLFQDQMGDLAKAVIGYAMPIVALCTALLMVSRVPYKRVHRMYIVGKKPFGQVVAFALLFAVFWSYKAPTLLFIVLWYGASGPVSYAALRFRGRHRAMQAGETVEHDDATQREAQ